MKRKKAEAASPAGKVVRWTIYKLGKKAKWLGYVEAASEREAIDKACAEFKIAEHERFRIAVRRD